MKIERSDLGVLLIIVSIVGILLTLALGGIGYYTGPKYDYNKAVGSHIFNAESAATPELMIDELNLAVSGMRDLGLTDDMYARWWSWLKTPDQQMAFQYALIDSIIDRCNEVITWRDAQDLSSGQVTDVYAQKMEALKETVRYDRADGIALNAYKVNICPFYGVYIFFILAALLYLFPLGLAMEGIVNDEPDVAALSIVLAAAFTAAVLLVIL